MSGHVADKGRVLGLGEALLRLSSVDDRLGFTDRLDLRVGGAELNCLIALAAFGYQTTWLTRLAQNPLGERISRHAREYDVTSRIDWDGAARAPLYFVEHGEPPRNSEVIYDRDGTAMRSLHGGTFDWENELAGASAALTSGITCALGTGATRAVVTFLAAARDRGIVTAFDVNHRRRLWDWDTARETLTEVLPHVSHLSASRADLIELLPGEGVGRAGASDVALAGEAIERWDLDGLLMRQRRMVVPGVVEVAATVVTADEYSTSEPIAARVVDGFGAGDAALAAFIDGVLTGYPPGALAPRCARATAQHLTVPGDAWQGSIADINAVTGSGIDR